MSEFAYVLWHGDDAVTDAVVRSLEQDGWRVAVGRDAKALTVGEEPAAGTHLYEPVPLTGEPVTADDIAAAVAFFLDRRSGYLTGQILHCCGGVSLLSSLSV
jgi:NAD(P)-dependent dehydrogenase (short-subunit alcohol dehydrogenase family)